MLGAMSELPDLDELWIAASGDALPRFDPAALAELPEVARRYLVHAIAPGTPLYPAVRLRMHGEIKLGADWHPFSAEQVIRWGRGLIWRARAQMGPAFLHLAIEGQDSYVDGEGAMRWKLAGLIPVMRAEGPDISRSAAGRLELESVLVPTVLVGDAVQWRPDDAHHTRATLHVPEHDGEIELEIDDAGRILSAVADRWGNPDGGEHHLARFGVLLAEHRSFMGVTIPTRIRAGWHFGTERFRDEGEFFRAEIDEATFAR